MSADVMTLGPTELHQRHQRAVDVLRATGRDDLLIALRRLSRGLSDTERARWS